MNSYLASLVPALANHLWQSTAFATAAWLLTVLLRKNSARVRYGVWLAASIKFLIPFSLLTAIGGLLPNPNQTVSLAVYTAMKITEQPFADVSLAPTASAAQTLTLTQRIAGDISGVFLALWLVGALTILVIWFVRWRRASVCLVDAVAVGDGRELEILRGLEARLSTRPRSPLRLRLSSERTEPSVYGILKPVLVWPRQLSERLSDKQIEAIIAHELVHAHRFDNATAALHMLVEAVFWFHPLVWWMERRMIEERERACDEIVVSLGGSPDTYAEGILKTCRFCVGSALPCITGVTGADLKKRVADIMTAHSLMRVTWPKKLLIGAAALFVVAVPVLLGQLQTSDNWEKAAGSKMSFEVASIKQNKSDDASMSNIPLRRGDVYTPTGGFFAATNVPLIHYIAFAYKITNANQLQPLLQQLPEWAKAYRFDIQARAAGNPTLDQLRLMMQSLLSDRFDVVTHYQTQQIPVFALVPVKTGKTGPGLRPHLDDPPCATADPASEPVAGGFPATCDRIVAMRPNQSGLRREGARNVLLGLVSNSLTAWGNLDRPVLDQTGLNGNFDFSLEWVPQADGPRPDGGDAQSESDVPTFIEALSDQLGLKLEPTTGPVNALVIDHIEEPSPN